MSWQTAILVHVSRAPGLHMRDLARRIGCSVATARKYAIQASAAGLVRVEREHVWATDEGTQFGEQRSPSHTEKP